MIVKFWGHPNGMGVRWLQILKPAIGQTSWSNFFKIGKTGQIVYNLLAGTAWFVLKFVDWNVSPTKSYLTWGHSNLKIGFSPRF